MKKVLAVLFTCSLFISCKKSSNSISEDIDVKYEISTNSPITNNPMGINNVAYYTTALNTLATENNLSGNIWNKTVKLKRGTPIVFEFTVNFEGINRTATGSIYINGVLKTTRAVTSIGFTSSTSVASTILTTTAD
jgi:hypothetical protein